MEKIVVSFDSVLWNNYTGEYGNVKEYLQILFKEKEPIPMKKLNFFKQDEKDNYVVAFDNLCENLWHKMKFHKATYLVLPYLYELVEKQDDKEWEFKILQAAGIACATEIKQYEDNPSNITKAFRRSKELILAKELDFINNNIEFLKRKSDFDRIELYVGIIALMGYSKLSYSLLMSMPWDKIFIECPHCRNTMDIEMKNIKSTKYAENFDRIKMVLRVMELIEDDKIKEKFEKFYEYQVCNKCNKKFLIEEGLQKNFIK